MPSSPMVSFVVTTIEVATTMEMMKPTETMMEGKGAIRVAVVARCGSG